MATPGDQGVGCEGIAGGSPLETPVAVARAKRRRRRGAPRAAATGAGPAGDGPWGGGLRGGGGRKQITPRAFLRQPNLPMVRGSVEHTHSGFPGDSEKGVQKEKYKVFFEKAAFSCEPKTLWMLGPYFGDSWGPLHDLWGCPPPLPPTGGGEAKIQAPPNGGLGSGGTCHRKTTGRQGSDPRPAFCTVHCPTVPGGDLQKQPGGVPSAVGVEKKNGCMTVGHCTAQNAGRRSPPDPVACR